MRQRSESLSYLGVGLERHSESKYLKVISTTKDDSECPIIQLKQDERLSIGSLGRPDVTLQDGVVPGLPLKSRRK